MNKICDACEFMKAPKNQILTTDHWLVGIGNDQPYLGRAYCTLKTHKGKLGELSKVEWDDLQSIFRELEQRYKRVFGADVINIECNMNHAFKEEPFNPHVHWHIYPRYKNSVEINGVVFEDPLFGSHIDESLVNIVDDEVVKEIIGRLQGI
jgi:diadenosine tetraphosphate (Ap4A) HIT family hydrolase